MKIPLISDDFESFAEKKSISSSEENISKIRKLFVNTLNDQVFVNGSLSL